LRPFSGYIMLDIFSKATDIQAVLSKERTREKSIGFVPTMGALHRGHLSLVKRAKEENSVTIASVFVNPTQFNDRKDYDLYRRDLSGDSQMLKEAGCDLLFAPPVEEMYPDESYKTINFNPGALGERLEGAHRPGHFAGVAAVVKRLFDIAQPDKAYFGQKDYQQYLIIRKLISDFGLPIEIVLCQTEREENGLAMSSRNERLSPKGRKEASLIYKVLQEAKQAVQDKSLPLREIGNNALKSLSTNGNFTVDYFDICSAEDLHTATEQERLTERLVICTAVNLEGVRLIDNVLV
jgi:pantoate--beta-alanine ligase